MRIAHPNGVQGRRPINRKKRDKKKKEIAKLQQFLKHDPKNQPVNKKAK